MQQQFLSIVADIAAEAPHIDVAFFPLTRVSAKIMPLAPHNFYKPLMLQTSFPCTSGAKPMKLATPQHIQITKPLTTHFASVKNLRLHLFPS